MLLKGLAVQRAGWWDGAAWVGWAAELLTQGRVMHSPGNGCPVLWPVLGQCQGFRYAGCAVPSLLEQLMVAPGGVWAKPSGIQDNGVKHLCVNPARRAGALCWRLHSSGSISLFGCKAAAGFLHLVMCRKQFDVP